MRLLVKNIARIVGIESTGRLRCCGADMNKLGTLDDAWLLAEDGRFAAFGRMDSLGDIAADEVVDAAGGMLFPSFCDSHTHLVYAGSREQEFLDKIHGLSYEEIARRGGGILNSADLLHATSEEELYRQAMERIREIAAKGTGAVEIKSGYGLTTADELKMLRVVRRIRETVSAAIATKKKEDCMFPTSDKYHLEINFKEHFKAYEGGFYPGAKQTGSRTIEFECTDWLDAMRFLHFVL